MLSAIKCTFSWRNLKRYSLWCILIIASRNEEIRRHQDVLLVKGEKFLELLFAAKNFNEISAKKGVSLSLLRTKH